MYISHCFICTEKHRITCKNWLPAWREEGKGGRGENKTTQYAFYNIILIFKPRDCVTYSNNYVTFLNGAGSDSALSHTIPPKIKLVESKL